MKASNLEVVEVTKWVEVPGRDNYFRTSDIHPFMKDGKLYVYNARGPRKSWGSPSVKSEVRELSSTVIEITVTGWHKFTRSPVGGVYYLVLGEKGWGFMRANARKVREALG